MEEENKKDLIIPVITIFFIGIIAGAGWGLGTKMNIDADDDGFTSMLTKNLCKGIQSADGSGKVEESCDNLLYLFMIISIFAGLVSIFSYIKLVGDWKVGLIIYVVSWVFGYLYITSNWMARIFG